MKKINPRNKPGQIILIVSLLIAISLLLISWFGIDYGIQRSLRSYATDLTVHWQSFVQQELQEFEQVFIKGEFSVNDRFLFDSANALLGVDRYKIITSTGNIVASSIPNEVGLTYFEAEGREAPWS